jgi:hypothetical protein
MADINDSTKKTTKSLMGGLLSLLRGSNKDSEILGKNASDSEVLGGIYKLMVQKENLNRLDYEKRKNYAEEQDIEQARRHAEIVKALTVRRKPAPKKAKAKKPFRLPTLPGRKPVPVPAKPGAPTAPKPAPVPKPAEPAAPTAPKPSAPAPNTSAQEAARRAQEETARRAQEETARKAREEAVRRAQEETARRAQEETARKAREAAEAARKAREAREAAEAAKKAKDAEEAARKAREAAEAAKRAKDAEEAARKAREAEESARRARESAEAARRAREAAEVARRAREANKRRDDRTTEEEKGVKAAGEAAKREADRKAREEATRKAREEADRKAREEATRKAREEADRKAREEATRKAREEADRRAREEAARKSAERVERKPDQPPTAQPAPPPARPPATAQRQPQGLGREGAGLIGLNALQRQAAIKKELFALGVTPVVAAGVMLVAAKETQAGQTLTEYGPQAYKDTWRNYESGKNKIPGDKYAKIKANPQKYLPGATSETLIPQSGPGAGTAYMNFTFQKFLTTEQWRKMIDAPNSDDFFAAVGYKGGEKYKGRSLIGVTHEGNYAAIGKLLGLDLVNNPELINRDVKTTTAATLAYLALTASGGIFNWKNLTQEKLKGSYQEGLKIINSYTNVDDLNKLLMLLTAGKGNVDVRNVEQVRAAFSGNSTRAILLRQQLESGVKTFKSLGLDKEELQPANVSSLGNNLSQMSSNNSDIRRSMNAASSSSTVVINQQNTVAGNATQQQNRDVVDDSSPYSRKSRA